MTRLGVGFAANLAQIESSFCRAAAAILIVFVFLEVFLLMVGDAILHILEDCLAVLAGQLENVQIFVEARQKMIGRIAAEGYCSKELECWKCGMKDD